MSFLETIRGVNQDEMLGEIFSKQSRDVEYAISKPGKRNIDDFKALISPAAEPYLEQMARLSSAMTRQRFGSAVSFYIPLYLSNLCSNSCSYCGFSIDNQIKRKTLNLDEIESELKAIKEKGYDSILLVTGEHERKVGVDYFIQVVPLVKRYFRYVALEVQPLSANEYIKLKSLGVNAVYVYQETYDNQVYSYHHKRGKKTDYQYRLGTAERLCESGLDKVGLGVLLGLGDWRSDSLLLAQHLNYLERKFWKTRYSISFPRLRPCAGLENDFDTISDRQLVQLICAYRIFNQEVELSLSTRETGLFRDNVIPLGITNISAESKTQPGGYSTSSQNGELEQFAISDERSTSAVADALMQRGLQPVFKDWEAIYCA